MPEILNAAEPVNAYVTGYPSWFTAQKELQEYRGNRFLVENQSYTRNTLPVEFFSHQLMQCKPEDDEDILKLASKYGIPRLPRWRYFSGGAGRSAEYLKRRASIILSDEMTERFFNGLKPHQDKAIAQHEPIIECHAGDWVSIEEARYALYDLQEWSRSLFEWLQGKSDLWSGAFIVDRIARTREIVPIMKSGCRAIEPDSNLTEAICTQIVETLTSVTENHATWRACRCGQWYVRFQPQEATPVDHPRTKKMPSRSVYCCLKCKNKYSKRDYDKAHKGDSEKATHRKG